jgi:hypothetical protein
VHAPVADLQAYEALLGTLRLHAAYPAPGTDWRYRWLAAGSTIGNAIPVDETIESFVTDAQIVVTRSAGVRTLELMVQVIAGDPIALARGEAALFAECERRNTLAIRPPHAASVPAVFEVINSHLDHAWNDVDETRLVRAYTLRLTCRPYSRSVDLDIVPALAQAAVVSTTTISDGTSATSWTGTVSTDGTVAAVTSASGQLRQTRFTYVESTGSKGEKTYRTNQTYTYTPASPIDATGKPYITADCHPPANYGGGWAFNVDAYADGVKLERVSVTTIDDLNGKRYRWTTTDTSIVKLEFRYLCRVTLPATTTAPGNVTTFLDAVLVTNQTASSGTGRQTLRSIDVGGSAPTQGSIRVRHATDALGDTLLYTYPDTGTGFRPDLRRWRTGGDTPNTNAGTISGQEDDLRTLTTYAMPVNTLPPGPVLPSAAYVLVVRAKGSDVGQGIVEWSIDGVTGTTYPNVTLGSAFIPIAGVSLPDIERGPLSEDTIDVTLRSLTTGGAPYLILDDAYLCYADEGAALTIVRTVPRNLWADAASLEHLNEAVFIGDQDDEVDKIAAGVLAEAREPHRFRPGRSSIFTATAGAAYPEVSASLYKRWAHWPAA